MNGYGSHTFKMVNKHEDAYYVKVRLGCCGTQNNFLFSPYQDAIYSLPPARDPVQFNARFFSFRQFHYKTDQGILNFDRAQADDLTRDDPDFSIRDLYNHIAEGKFPTWTLHIQVCILPHSTSAKAFFIVNLECFTTKWFQLF